MTGGPDDVRDVELFAPGPLHQVSHPHTAWTTVNAAENIPGVMTPLGASLWLEVVELGVRGAFASLGALRRSDVHAGRHPDDRFSGIFFGRFAGRIDQFRWALDRLPGASSAAFEEQMLGSVREDVVERPVRSTYPAVMIKAPVVVARLPRDIAAQTRDLRAWWSQVTAGESTPSAVPQLRAAYHHAAEAMRMQALATFVAQGLYDKLGALATRAGCPDAHLTLMTGYGGTEETQMVAALYDIAHHGGSLPDFLAAYGARCPGENELSARSWREDPTHVERLIVQYRNATTRPDPRTQHDERVHERTAAEDRVLAGLRRPERGIARALFRLGQRYIPLREEGKGSLAMTMDAARAAARNRGGELTAAGLLDDPEDVFYLTLSEVLHEPLTDARTSVTVRKVIRAEYEQFELPQSWIGNPQPIRRMPRADDPVRSLTGMAGAAGIVEGRARVVVDAHGIDDIEPDEILVCRTTDPSWAAAFHLVSAAVIDVGGPASHGAIVAREMGLPCVINTRVGTATLRTGDRLRVDGSAGTVIVLDRAP